MRETNFRAPGVLDSRHSWAYGDYFSQYKNGVTTHYIISHPNGREASPGGHVGG